MAFRRRTLRSCASIALCGFLLGWLLPFFEAHPIGFDDDAACESALIGKTTAEQLRAVDPNGLAPAHCVLCHLMRALNGSHIAGVAQVAAPASDRVTIPAQPDPLVSAFSSTSTSRGHPAHA